MAALPAGSTDVRTLLLCLGFLAASAHAEERPRFDAKATLQRARVGTYSARLAPPVRVSEKPKAEQRERAARPSDFERMTCREDPAAPHTLLCEPKRIP